MDLDAALHYEERWPLTWIVIGACGYLLFLGVMWGTSIRNEMPKFLLYFATAFLIVKGSFILSHQRSIDVDLEARTATESRRCFGLRLMPRIYDLAAVRSVYLERTDNRYIERTKPVSQQRASNVEVVHYVHLVSDETKHLTVFGCRSREAAAERAALWSSALGVPVVDHLSAELPAESR